MTPHPYDGAGGDPNTTDAIADLIGDYRAFTALQRDRLGARGIDILPCELSHLAVRVPERDQYVHLRTIPERHAVANVENVWNGRPISLILLASRFASSTIRSSRSLSSSRRSTSVSTRWAWSTSAWSSAMTSTTSPASTGQR
ncbi:MAG: VOC family protein [Chloroflexi bacterium]|nr:VOC family protein [Chloroflexota bacterium]